MQVEVQGMKVLGVRTRLGQVSEAQEAVDGTENNRGQGRGF